MRGNGRGDRWFNDGGENIQRTSLISRVLKDDVSLLVLVLSERDENDVAVVNPDLFPELATDETETLDAVEALEEREGLVWCLTMCCCCRG